MTVLAAWPTPPRWLQPARQQLIAVLSWTREHWLNASAIGAAAGIAGVLVSIMLYRLGQRRPGETREQAEQARVRERQVFLRRVRYKWIAGVLEPSLAHAAHLALGLETRSDTLDLEARTSRRPDDKPRPITPGTPIVNVFNQVGSGLLILGEPGAGKTTLLLELARDLLNQAEDRLDHAEQDPAIPLPALPVVANLDSWARDRQPLSIWLVEKLKVDYGVPERIGHAWVKEGALILLLDGLDEVAEAHRTACAAAINDYHSEHGLVPLAVCSRTRELRALRVALGLREAVELQPPSNAQIADYLDKLEATGTPLADVREALNESPGLRALLRSPLMLHVITLAYHGRPAPALRRSGSLAQRRALLWQAYIARMFEQRRLSPDVGYTQEQALGWLVWLARSLRDRDQTEFQLDRLTPDWLPTPAHRRRVRRAVRPVGWLAGKDPDSIKPAEELHWSWTRLIVGLLSGLRGWLALAVGAGLAAGVAMWLSGGFSVGLADGLAAGLLAGLTAGLFVGPLGVLLGVLDYGGAAVVQHYVVRAVLVRAQVAPWRYGSFLEAMTERLLLRRSGSGYLFVHRLLRDYLADLPTPPGPQRQGRTPQRSG